MKHTIDNISNTDIIINSWKKFDAKEKPTEDGQIQHEYQVYDVSIYYEGKQVILYRNEIIEIYNKIMEIEKEKFFDYPEY